MNVSRGETRGASERACVRAFDGRLQAANAYEACVNNAEESRCHGAP